VATAPLTKQQFSDTFGVSTSQLERLFQEGMPHDLGAATHGKRRRVTIPMPDGRVWYHRYLVNKGRKEAAPTTLDDERRRHHFALAEMAELELAKARDELMTVTDFERLLGDAFARVRARLQNLAARQAGGVLGATSIEEAQKRLEPLVREAMEELRAASDVPQPEEPEPVLT
jgi:hypothetical protein